MRVNAYERKKGDPVYRILFDGKDITHICYEADDEEGYALCYYTNEYGRFELDSERQEAKKLPPMHGRVEIKPTGLREFQIKGCDLGEPCKTERVHLLRQGQG